MVVVVVVRGSGCDCDLGLDVVATVFVIDVETVVFALSLVVRVEAIMRSQLWPIQDTVVVAAGMVETSSGPRLGGHCFRVQRC